MSNAIDDEVATSSKIPATAKPDTPAQPGMTKSPAKVAKRPTTVDAAMGKDREREPARDSLPIYQTRRSILLREEPRFGAPSQIMLDAGARLIVLEINGPWLKVNGNRIPGLREERNLSAGRRSPSGLAKIKPARDSAINPFRTDFQHAIHHSLRSARKHTLA
jgi:hypothetical protein